MRVLILGAYGFIGRNIAKYFHQNGYVVYGIGHGNWDRKEFQTWGIHNWVESDIITSILEKYEVQFDIIINCSGSGSVRKSVLNPGHDFNNNVITTREILEYIRNKNNQAKFIHISSPAIQGEISTIFYDVKNQTNPISPYGLHKKISEDLCLFYNKFYGINIGIVRLFSVYGEDLNKQILFDACEKIYNSKYNDIITFNGTGMETRDFIYINDVASFIYNFINNLDSFKIENCGTGISTSISYIVEEIKKLLNRETTIIKFTNKKDIGNPTNLIALLNSDIYPWWKPNTTIEEGLKLYVTNYLLKK